MFRQVSPAKHSKGGKKEVVEKGRKKKKREGRGNLSCLLSKGVRREEDQPDTMSSVPAQGKKKKKTRSAEKKKEGGRRIPPTFRLEKGEGRSHTGRRSTCCPPPENGKWGKKKGKSGEKHYSGFVFGGGEGGRDTKD